MTHKAFLLLAAHSSIHLHPIIVNSTHRTEDWDWTIHRDVVSSILRTLPTEHHTTQKEYRSEAVNAFSLNGQFRRPNKNGTAGGQSYAGTSQHNTQRSCARNLSTARTISSSDYNLTYICGGGLAANCAYGRLCAIWKHAQHRRRNHDEI